MALRQYTEELKSRSMIEGKKYRIIAIGPAGAGGNGGKSTGKNNTVSGEVLGAYGGGGGAGAYIYVGEFTATADGSMAIAVQTDKIMIRAETDDEEKIFSLEIPTSGNGGSSLISGISVSKPGDSISSGVYVGSRGGGAGGTWGSRNSGVPSTTQGGIGTNGDGASSVPGTLIGSHRSAGVGAVGGGNPITTQGAGGQGLKDSGFEITVDNVLSLTANQIAKHISGGNGGTGSAPAMRAVQAGIGGGEGGGGGGAWTSGNNGGMSGSTSAGVNGNGGIGGIGGTGCVWIYDYN